MTEKVRSKIWKPLLSMARQEQRRSSYCGFQATLDLLEEVRKKNIMNHWTFLKHDGTTGKQEAHLDSLTHSTSHSRSLSSFTWVFSKPTTRHQSSGEAGNGCRRQRDRQSCKFVRKPDLGVEHSDAHRKWLQLNKTDEFYRLYIRNPTITDQPDTSTSQFVVASQETNITACCLWELQQCGMDVGLDGGQVAKTFSGDRITVSLTIVNCLRSLTQAWISQMRIPLAQDLDHDQGPQSRLDTARSGDLYTPQGFSREAQRVTYKAIVLGVFKENTMFDWNWPMLGIIGNQEAYHLFARFTGFETPPPKINIQLYVGISRVHQQLIKYSGEADFDDDSDSIVTDDTAFDADHFDDSTESSRCERLYNSAPSSRPHVDWDRINILGTELLNVLQTIPRPVFGLDGYISADDSSCRYGVQHVLDNICSWYKSYQQEQGMLELDPADNDELPWKQGERLSEQSQDPDRTILIRAGRLCEETETRMNPEVMLLHLMEAEEVLLSTTHEAWEVEDLGEEWREWFGVQRIIRDYLTYLADHGYNRHSDKACLPHLAAIQKKAGSKSSSNAEGLYATVDKGRSRVPFWVPNEEWPLWEWDPVRGKHIKARFDVDSPIEDAPTGVLRRIGSTGGGIRSSDGIQCRWKNWPGKRQRSDSSNKPRKRQRSSSRNWHCNLMA
ncbi:MAG: hypothetical protein J3Q66DRAFT_445948 [Benniella sp.]|nr:MAG: hypothetical protein J3Q66DRAFT_445948 [Benniella sp.]